MPVKHPLADRDAAPAAATVGTATYAVGDDGVIDCPADAVPRVADALAGAYDANPADILIDVCPERKSDGDLCGRDKPCPYHSDENGE